MNTPPILGRHHPLAGLRRLHQWVQSRALTDQVSIVIPASTPHIGLVRATASALAALLDFTYDRIMDLHIAIDEVCSRIMATSEPAPITLRVEFALQTEGLRITACGDSATRSGVEFLTTWSRAILDSVTEGVELAESDGVTSASFVIPRG
jgi:serine/threonine-protein kinase RsbW